MFTICKATSEDFERVFPLLQDFENAAISKQTWKKIFALPWKTEEDFCGYLLIKDGEVKGYLGLIFSRREFKDRTEKLCNMTSWIVDQDCRSQSLSLLLELLKLKDYTLTNFTASPTVQNIVSKLGFQEFKVDQRVLLPVPAFALTRAANKCEFDLQAIQSKLSGEELRIFSDHQGLNCRHLLLQCPSGDCYVVLKNTRRKKLTFAKVHYLGNAAVFKICIESVIAKICVRLRVFGLMVDERYIAGHSFRGSLKYPQQRQAYFRSNSAIDSNRIDTIYSELVILHD
jgi:hypothetical protein